MQNISKKIPFSFLEVSLLCIFTYFCFEYKPFEHKFLHGVSKIFLSKPYPQLSSDLLIFLSDLIVLLSALFCMNFFKASIFEKEKKWLLIVFVFAVLSILFTPYTWQLHGYVRSLQLFFAFFFFYTLSTILSKKNPIRFIRTFLAIIAIIGVIESFIGISHYLLQEPIGLKKFGEPKLSQNFEFASIPNSNGKVWIFNFFQTNASFLFRSHGTFPHPNIFGCFLVTSLLASLYWMFSAKRVLKTVISIGIFFQILCLIVTFSRSALLSFGGGSIFLLLFFKLFFQKKIFFTSSLVIGSLLIGGIIFFPQIYDRGGVINQSELSKGSNSSRNYYNKIAMKMMFAHPVLGVGYDLFTANINKFVSEEELNPSLGSTVHNIYLLIGSQTGIFSLFSFLMFLGLIVKNGFKNLSLESGSLLCIFSCYLIIGFFDYFFLFFQQPKILFFSIAGMLSGYASYFSKTSEAHNEGCSSILYSKEETEKC